MTLKVLAVTIPVASVLIDLKFVPKVSVNEVVPKVVTKNVTSCPAIPPVALKVAEPVGVIVIIEVVILTDITPVVALVETESVNTIGEPSKVIMELCSSTISESFHVRANV